MNDWAIGKRMFEEIVLEQVLESFPSLSGRQLKEEALGDIAERDPPDFVIGLDGRVLGIELAEIRDVDDSWGYYEETWCEDPKGGRRPQSNKEFPSHYVRA